jgi:hypothetical protein
MPSRWSLNAGVAVSMALASACSESSPADSPGTDGGGETTASGGALGSGGVGVTGGQPGSGGSTTGSAPGEGGSGGGASCENVPPCGGNVVGAWTVTASCLAVLGEVDLSPIGIGCRFAPVSGALGVTGTWTATSDGKYLDDTTTTGDELIVMQPSCFAYSGTVVHCKDLDTVVTQLGYALASCTDAGDGGCSCAVTVNQRGKMGLVSFEAPTSGNYTTSGNVVTLDGEAEYTYCVSGDTMTWTPQSTSPTVTGTFAFQKQ